MRHITLKTVLGAALLALVTGGSAQAASLCVPLPGANADGLKLSDVTLGGSSASGCYGIVSGNNTGGTNINTTLGGALLFGEAELWGSELKDDNPGGLPDGSLSYYGVNWTLAAGSAGTWTLSFADANPSVIPFKADLLVILKGGESYAAYFFNDFLFDAASESGTYQMFTTFNAKGKSQTNALSHMSLYFRGATPVGDCPPNEPDCEEPEVPEPASLLLLGMGLLGAGVGAARRRNRK